jgi:hypothetical protein
MVCVLVLLQSWEVGWYMAPLLAYLTPLYLSSLEWTRCSRHHIIWKYITLVPVIPLKAKSGTPYVLTHNFHIFHVFQMHRQVGQLQLHLRQSH